MVPSSFEQSQVAALLAAPPPPKELEEKSEDGKELQKIEPQKIPDLTVLLQESDVELPPLPNGQNWQDKLHLNTNAEDNYGRIPDFGARIFK